MSELRRDPVVGFWTIISEERGWRPVDFQPKKIVEERDCPFCEGKENQTTHEVYAFRPDGGKADSPGWQIRSILSKVPILSSELENEEPQAQGLYDTRDGVGQHEVIVETPRHQHDLDEFSLEMIERVLKTYVLRIKELEKNPRYEYALLFKNHGLVSGSATDVIRHSRSQLIGMPIIPKRAKEQLAMTKNYFERRERCVFCDMLKQELKDGSRSVVENDAFFAFCPFASRSPFEMWILPKKHSADFTKLADEAIPDLAKTLKQCLGGLAQLLNDPPYNFILHTAPFRHRQRAGFWRTIEEDYHWYLQIMPRLTMNAGFEWGTGIHINPTSPEEAAALLRDACGEIS